VVGPAAREPPSEDRHDRIAIAEDLLDVVSTIEQFEALLGGAGEGPQQAEEGEHATAVGRIVIPLATDIDVVCLDVEDELVLGPLFLECLLVGDLLGADLVDIAEYLVEGEQGRCHTAAGAQEVAAAKALTSGPLLAERFQTGCVFELLRRGGWRDELLIGGDAGGDGWRSIVGRVEVTLANPHG